MSKFYRETLRTLIMQSIILGDSREQIIERIIKVLDRPLEPEHLEIINEFFINAN